MGGRARLLPPALALGAGALLAGAALAGGQSSLVAQLEAVAPAHGASGRFSATVADGKGQTNLQWQLSVSHLSGPVTSAALRAGRSGITIPLCQPCAAPVHGALAVIPAVWKKLQAEGPVVVVSTRAHPKGELRGKLKSG